MDDVLIDTDVFVDTLRGSRGFLPGKAIVYYSTITRAELFAGRHADEDGLRALLAPLREIPVDRALAEEAGRLRRKSGVALPDAIIAASAMTHRLALVTRNRRDYTKIRGLRIVDPG